eukprot:10000525-Prorocentrum_lima.AAC.1
MLIIWPIRLRDNVCGHVPEAAMRGMHARSVSLHDERRHGVLERLAQLPELLHAAVVDLIHPLGNHVVLIHTGSHQRSTGNIRGLACIAGES